MKLNFTVRTLLILTTLVAVVLTYPKLFGWNATNVCLGILTIFVAAGLVQQIADATFPVAAGAIANRGRQLILGCVLACLMVAVYRTTLGSQHSSLARPLWMFCLMMGSLTLPGMIPPSKRCLAC